MSLLKLIRRCGGANRFRRQTECNWITETENEICIFRRVLCVCNDRRSLYDSIVICFKLLAVVFSSSVFFLLLLLLLDSFFPLYSDMCSSGSYVFVRMNKASHQQIVNNKKLYNCTHTSTFIRVCVCVSFVCRRIGIHCICFGFHTSHTTHGVVDNANGTET